MTDKYETKYTKVKRSQWKNNKVGKYLLKFYKQLSYADGGKPFANVET